MKLLSSSSIVLSNGVSSEDNNNNHHQHHHRHHHHLQQNKHKVAAAVERGDEESSPSITTTRKMTNNNHEEIINGDIVRVTPRKQHSLLLIVWGLLANIMFCIGTISFVGFTLLEFQGRERSIKANIYYGVAFSSFFLNGTLELLIDVCLSRTFRHGRYTSKQPYNILISLLFIIGSTLDTWAFFLWNIREFVKEHRVQYGSSHTFLLAMIIVFAIEGFGGCFGFGCFEQRKDTRSLMFVDGLDGVANMLFMLGVIIDCVVRYLDEPTEPRATDSVAYLELISAILFIPTSLIYICADIIRFVDYGKHKEHNNSQYNSNTVERDVELGNGRGGGNDNNSNNNRRPRREEDRAPPPTTTKHTENSNTSSPRSKKNKKKKKRPQQQQQLPQELSASKRHPQPNKSDSFDE